MTSVPALETLDIVLGREGQGLADKQPADLLAIAERRRQRQRAGEEAVLVRLSEEGSPLGPRISLDGTLSGVTWEANARGSDDASDRSSKVARQGVGEARRKSEEPGLSSSRVESDDGFPAVDELLRSWTTL